eukprot:867004-Prorocentrum_minimum.AAC.2
MEEGARGCKGWHEEGGDYVTVEGVEPVHAGLVGEEVEHERDTQVGRGEVGGQQFRVLPAHPPAKVGHLLHKQHVVLRLHLLAEHHGGVRAGGREAAVVLVAAAAEDARHVVKEAGHAACDGAGPRARLEHLHAKRDHLEAADLMRHTPPQCIFS